ncbi:hypothetical protein BS47DRAFT_1338726, partial [Hydnum rufescens UP504]
MTGDSDPTSSSSSPSSSASAAPLRGPRLTVAQESSLSPLRSQFPLTLSFPSSPLTPLARGPYVHCSGHRAFAANVVWTPRPPLVGAVISFDVV